MLDSKHDYENHPPDDSGYYDVFHAPYIKGGQKPPNLSYSSHLLEQKHIFPLCMQNSTPVYKMTEKRLFVAAVAVNHTITLAFRLVRRHPTIIQLKGKAAPIPKEDTMVLLNIQGKQSTKSTGMDECL